MVNLSKMPSSRILLASDAHWSAMTSESGEGWARPNLITEAQTTSRRPRGAVPAVTSDTRVGSWMKLETSVNPEPREALVGSPDKKALVTSDKVVTQQSEEVSHRGKLCGHGDWRSVMAMADCRRLPSHAGRRSSFAETGIDRFAEIPFST